MDVDGTAFDNARKQDHTMRYWTVTYAYMGLSHTRIACIVCVWGTGLLHGYTDLKQQFNNGWRLATYRFII